MTPPHKCSSKQSSHPAASRMGLASRHGQLVFTITLVLLCQSWLALAKSTNKVYYVPSSAQTGHVVTVLPMQEGQLSKIQDAAQQDPWHKFFTVLGQGELITTSNVSPLGGEVVSLTIEHSLSSSSERWTETISIAVEDSNRNIQFENQPYSGYISENEPSGSPVQQLEELEEHISKLPYGCTVDITSGHASVFEVRYAGKFQLLARNSLDRELVEKYYLVLEVACPSGMAHTMVKVQVLDVNDNTPELTDSTYRATISMDDPTLELQIQGSDADKYDTVRYMLTEESDLFGLDPASGILSLKDGASRQLKTYIMSVYAIDQVGNVSPPAEIQIEVLPEEEVAPAADEYPNSSEDVNTRVRRATRESMTFAVRMDRMGLLMDLSLETDEGVRYEFSETILGLTIDNQQGVVRRSNDNIDIPDVTFTIHITKPGDDTYFDTLSVRLHVLSREFSDPIFTNEPKPMWVRIPVWIRPGTVIETVQAADTLPPYRQTVDYVLESGGDGQFEVDRASGEIRIVGRQQFIVGTVYQLAISAIPQRVIEEEGATPVQVVHVKVDDIRPQFYKQPRYEIGMSERAQANDVVGTIDVVSFQELPMRFTMTTYDGGNTDIFRISQADDDSAEIRLLKKQRHIYDGKQYRLKVTAQEQRSNLESTTDVVITVVSENENEPFFPSIVYVAKDISESIGTDREIIRVTAIDRDLGDNGRLEFRVSDSHFKVDTTDGKTAVIRTADELDYDRLPNHMYEFILTAEDQGQKAEEQRTGTTTVQVFVTNVDDELPTFSPQHQLVKVKERCPENTLIHVVQAFDPERNGILSFLFNTPGGASSNVGIFAIDQNGHITLTADAGRNREDITLYVLARNSFGTSEGTVSVQFIGINTPPIFTECSSIVASVPEQFEGGDYDVYNILATDEDSGTNGEIEYSVIWRDEKLFDLEDSTRNGEKSANLFTTKIFDRERPEDSALVNGTNVKYRVTVQATDKGVPPLSTTCFFFVDIVDINDNAPIFDLTSYRARIMREAPRNPRDTWVIRVFATDDDAGENANVIYTIEDDSECSGCFTIDRQTGAISRRNGAIFNSADEVEIKVRAQDTPDTGLAKSSIAVVVVELTDDSETLPPYWLGDLDDLTNITIDENAPPLTKLGLLPRAEGVGSTALNLYLQRGRTLFQNSDADFSHVVEGAVLNLEVDRLDYTITPEYSLRITVSYQNGPTEVFTDARVSVLIKDVNDRKPEFEGLDASGKYPAAVSGETKNNEYVVKVTAVDLDGTYPNNKVIYSFASNCGEDCNDFSINEETGEIRARKQGYDREVKRSYALRVEARDGAASAVRSDDEPNKSFQVVTVQVIGSTQEPPYFEQRQHSTTIPEAQQFNYTVDTIEAENPDKDLNIPQYQIIAGNTKNAFGVDSGNGRLYVMSLLLIEDQAVYTLTYRVFDGHVSNTTMVTVTLSERNLFSPAFGNLVYTNDNNIDENDASYSKSNPKFITTVAASDSDSAPGSPALKYGLEGPLYTPERFSIEEDTGRIFLTAPLERDNPDGYDPWTVTVTATDTPTDGTAPNTGYAVLNINLADDNDNAPVFDTCCLEGSVREGMPSTPVMTLKVIDHDEGINADVIYEAVSVPDEFSLNSNTGEISTTGAARLDREGQDSYTLVVKARDRGSPSLSSPDQTVWITVADANDNVPFFMPDRYQVDLDENLPVGASAFTLSATDADVGENAQLSYSLMPGADSRFFYIDSILEAGTGVLKIKEEIDYDTMQSSDPLTVTVRVTDDEGSRNSRYGDAEVTFKVVDVNDNAPVFSTPYHQVNLTEDTKLDTLIFEYKAMDMTELDTGINANYDFFIDYENTDQNKIFAVESDTGRVTLRSHLDYEVSTQHTVHILAIDHGIIPQTGTATLQIYVEDINDNAPQLRSEPNFGLGSGIGAGDEVAKFYVDDADSAANGPPFTIKTECNSADCSLFSLRSGSDSGGNYGILTANSAVSPGMALDYGISITDTAGPGGTAAVRQVKLSLTATGPGRNTRASEPGVKEIDVYNFARELENAEIGHVFFEDVDGWNTAGKTFEFVGEDPGYFRLSEDEPGMLIMERGTPKGQHEFKVEVSDSQGSAISTVKVNITYIEAEHVRSSGSMRLTAPNGITAKDFVKRDSKDGRGVEGTSMYDKLRTQLATLLDTDTEYVQIFTVRDVQRERWWDTKQVDVMFAAHGSPYYRPARLNGLVWANKNKLETEMGNSVQIFSSPIDLCPGKICYGEGCHNQLVTDHNPQTIDGGVNSLIAINAHYEASCVCGATMFSDEPAKCQPDSCPNNGTCVQHWNGYDCECHPDFEGPDCQMLKLSFDGDGWAWMEPLSGCKDGKTSFELITTQPNSLLLYNGPMYAVGAEDRPDFMSVELVGGKPRVRVDLGSGMVTLDVPGGIRLDDGKWHTVEIFKQAMEFQLVVDHCESAKVDESINFTSSDRQPCQQIRRAPGDDYILNVHTPLELGGRDKTGINYPVGLSSGNFKGCLKNLRHNGMLYDLEIEETGQYKGATNMGCPAELGCDTCGANSMCIGSFDGGSECVCHPGWTGSKCDKETTVRDFYEDESYVEWDVKPGFNNTLSSFVSEFQMRFRTRQSDGMLFTTTSFSTLEHIKIGIMDTAIFCQYDLGSGNEVLDLPYVNVSDGRWHVVKVNRYGNQMVLLLDGGEGKFYTESFPTDLHRWIFVKDAYTAASLFYKNKYHVDPVVTNDILETCVTDIRYKNKVFPLGSSDNTEPASIKRIQGDLDGCDSASCTGVVCPDTSVCADYWRIPYCVCPTPMLLVDNHCTDIGDCSVPRCVNGDCVTIRQEPNQELRWFCNCWDGWMGANCDNGVAALSDNDTSLSTAALIIIIICLLALLILILIGILWMRRRKPEYLLGVDPGDDIRENVVEYDEEGAGEEDMHAYDLSRLRKPVDPESPENAPYNQGRSPNMPNENYPRTREELPKTAPEVMSPPRPFLLPGDYPNVGDFIDDRMNGADDDPNAPPYDSVREYEYEGGGSNAGSLSSLCTSSSGDQDYDYLNDYGPPFKKLADMYGGGQDEDASSV